MSVPTGPDLLKQTIVSDEVYRIWECQALFTATESGEGIVRYVGKVGPQCRGCGDLKDFNVIFKFDENPGMDDVLAKITAQVDAH